MTTAVQEDKGKKPSRKMVGKIVSDKMEKTIVVAISRTFRHAVYGKVVNRLKKYKVHDEENSGKIGDLVEIQECRPLSKTKHMVLKRVIEVATERK